MPIQKSKVTIFDVAKASGVSSSAVSYASTASLVFPM